MDTAVPMYIVWAQQSKPQYTRLFIRIIGSQTHALTDMQEDYYVVDNQYLVVCKCEMYVCTLYSQNRRNHSEQRVVHVLKKILKFSWNLFWVFNYLFKLPTVPSKLYTTISHKTYIQHCV